MPKRPGFLIVVFALAAAACAGPGTGPADGSPGAAGAPIDPPVMRGVEGIPGWRRAGAPERYAREALYGYIDGGAEIVLEYGFRELSVQRFAPAAAGPSGRGEITLEIYRMTSGEAAFGLYSSRLEGGEKAWPGLRPDNWIGPGQANLVKGDYLVNVLSPACGEAEIGEFLAAVESQVPGRGTVRPECLERLPAEGMVPSSRRYIRGPLAARNESPFLEGAFWGFAPAAGANDATVAVSAKYGSAPKISKLVIVELGPAVDLGAVDAGVLAAFKDYLQAVRPNGPYIEGLNDLARCFLYRRAGRTAVLVLGEDGSPRARGRIERVLGEPPAGNGP